MTFQSAISTNVIGLIKCNCFDICDRSNLFNVHPYIVDAGFKLTDS